jgi:hypothetical protein
MKRLFVVFMFLFCVSGASAQGWLPPDVDFTLGRIEQAIRSGDPSSIEDLLVSGMTMRLGDSLYESISSITALDALQKFFEDKDTIDFQFGLPGSGTMMYSSAGKQDTVAVDVWLRRIPGGIGIYALNISNYPLATVFFRMSRQKETPKK